MRLLAHSCKASWYTLIIMQRFKFKCQGHVRNVSETHLKLYISKDLVGNLILGGLAFQCLVIFQQEQDSTLTWPYKSNGRVSLEHHMLSGRPGRAAPVAPVEKLGPLTLQEDQSLRHLLLQPGILLLLSPHCSSDIRIYIMC